MWFKNLKIYRLSSPWTLVGEQLEETRGMPIRPAAAPAPTISKCRAWAGCRRARTADWRTWWAGRSLLTLRAEKKLLPGTVVNQVAKARAQEIEEQQGYKPGRKQMKEIKERVTDELLPRAFSVYRDTRVWIDPQNHWLVIDAAASAKADEVIGLLAAHRPVPAGKPVRGPVARLGHDRLAGRGRGAVQLHHRPGHRAALVRRKRRGDPIRQALHRRRRRAPPHPVRQAVHAPGHDLGRPHLLRADREPGRQARRAAGRAQAKATKPSPRTTTRSSIPT